MEQFLSTYTNRIDRKGRVSVPAEFRAVLARRGSAGLLLYPVVDLPAIEGGGEDFLAELKARIDSLPPLSPERDHLIDAVMPRLRRLGFDSEGRIMLPVELVQHAGLNDAAVFVGRFSNFQIWHPAKWEERQRHAIELSRAMRAQAGQR